MIQCQHIYTLNPDTNLPSSLKVYSLINGNVFLGNREVASQGGGKDGTAKSLNGTPRVSSLRLFRAKDLGFRVEGLGFRVPPPLPLSLYFDRRLILLVPETDEHGRCLPAKDRTWGFRAV